MLVEVDPVMNIVLRVCWFESCLDKGLCFFWFDGCLKFGFCLFISLVQVCMVLGLLVFLSRLDFGLLFEATGYRACGLLV